jgi:hypothetical protein
VPEGSEGAHCHTREDSGAGWNRGIAGSTGRNACKQTVFQVMRDQSGTRQKPAVVHADLGNKT